MVHESWSYLNTALMLEARGLSEYLSEEYLSRTIGMFEQNNVGVRLRSPLAEKVDALYPGGGTGKIWGETVKGKAAVLPPPPPRRSYTPQKSTSMPITGMGEREGRRKGEKRERGERREKREERREERREKREERGKKREERREKREERREKREKAYAIQKRDVSNLVERVASNKYHTSLSLVVVRVEVVGIWYNE